MPARPGRPTGGLTGTGTFKRGRGPESASPRKTKAGLIPTLREAEKYELYGLHLATNSAVAGLVPVPADSPAEVEVHFGHLPAHVSREAPPGSRIRREDLATRPTLWEADADGYFRILFADGTLFLIGRDGREVWGVWPETATLEDAVTYLTSTVMGFVLSLHGVTCLHASAAVVGEQAVVVAGPAGAGKSTTAAVFAKCGYPVLADDIVALDERGSDFYIRPGYPRICLWPEAAEHLFGSLPLLTPTWSKHYLNLGDAPYRFQDRPARAAAVYLLSVGEASDNLPRVEEVTHGDTLIQLIANSYMRHLLGRSQRAREFELLGRMANRVPVRRLVRAAGWERAKQTCEVVAEDLESIGATNPKR